VGGADQSGGDETTRRDSREARTGTIRSAPIQEKQLSILVLGSLQKNASIF